MFYLFIIFGIISGALGYIFIDKMGNMSNLANLIKMQNLTDREIQISNSVTEKNYLRRGNFTISNKVEIEIDSKNTDELENKNSITIKYYLLRREIANHIDF